MRLGIACSEGFPSILQPWNEFRSSVSVVPSFNVEFLRNWFFTAQRILLYFVQTSQCSFNLKLFQKSNGSRRLALGQPEFFCTSITIIVFSIQHVQHTRMHRAELGLNIPGSLSPILGKDMSKRCNSFLSMINFGDTVSLLKII